MVHSWLPWFASSNISTCSPQPNGCRCPALPCGFDPPFPCCCIKGRQPHSHWCVRVVLVCASEAFVWTPWLRHGKLTQRATRPGSTTQGAFWCGSRDTLDMSLTRLYHFGTRFCWAGPRTQLSCCGTACLEMNYLRCFSGAFETTPRTDRMVLTTAPKLARARAWNYRHLMVKYWRQHSRKASWQVSSALLQIDRLRRRAGSCNVATQAPVFSSC